MLTFNNVSFRYPGSTKLVLDTISLNLEPGHIYGLLGKNGVGKSTLFRLISGLNPPSSGIIQTMEFTPFERCPEMMQNLFLVPEDILFPAMTPIRYAQLYGAFYHNYSQNDFERLLSEFSVDRNAKLSTMSQGQKKKAYIAFALACNTPILLMDEPTNGLDIPSKTIFRRILAEQIHPDRIIIISTHQVRDLELLIDAVIILHDCRIALCEKAEHIQKIVNFGKITPETDPDRIIYQDVAVRGTVGMTSHLPDEPQQGIDDFDLEILFNAVTHPSEGERIQNILAGCSV